MQEENQTLTSISLLAATHENQEEINKAAAQAKEAGAEMLHIDVMDGKFVEQQTIWNDPQTIKKIKTDLPLDVHIMIEKPDERYLEFIHAKANMLTFHIEAARNPEIILSKLHRWHVKAGIAINPQTPLEKILPYTPLIDYVLVMSVKPGKAGQQFKPETLEKIHYLKTHYPHITIGIDGGINEETARLAREAGATILVSGSGFYKATDKKNYLETLKGI